jgi:hypothetical protein
VENRRWVVPLWYRSASKATIADRESSGPSVRASSENNFRRRCNGICSNAAVKLSSRSETPVRKFLCFERREAASCGTTREIV